MRAIAMAAALFSLTSFAGENAAKEAFLADAKVQERVQKAGARYHLGEAQAIFLKESCGVLGCITDYLVGAPLWDLKMNSQSSSILSKIQLTGDTVMFLQVLPEYTSSITTD